MSDMQNTKNMKNMKNNTSKDMTQGNPTSLLLTFMLPMLVGNIFQQFYNMVDTMVVGKFVNADALAAVGSTGSITNLFFCLCNGLATGIGIIVSQYFGAKDLKKMRLSIINAFYIVVASGLVMGTLGVLLARPVLILLSTPDRILDNAVIYMQITCMGIIGTALYNAIASILRGIGDSKTPLYFLIISSILNIVLDLFFVIVLHWGVPGVAAATVFSQLLSAVCSIAYAFIRNPLFSFGREEFLIDRFIIRECFRLGIPMALQTGMMAFSFVILQRVINSFGPAVMAAWTATSRIETIINQPFRSLGNSISTYAGQNVGARKYDRVKLGTHSGLIMTTAFALVMLPIIWFGGESIMLFFVKAEETEVISIGVAALRMLAFFYIPLGVIYVYRGTLNGAGDARFALLAGISEMCGRIFFPGPISMISGVGFWGLWIGTGLTWVLVGVTAYLRYRTGIWQYSGTHHRAHAQNRRKVSPA